MNKLRRSMIFCPGNNVKMISKAHTYGADCIIFDLEDAIAISEKENARKILSDYISNLKDVNTEIFVRINSLNTKFGENDVKELLKSGLKNIRLPMCENRNDIVKLCEMLSFYENKYDINHKTKIQAAIESPKGVMNASEISTSSERVISISFGAEDYTNCLNVNRSKNLIDMLYARSHVAICANIAGIDSCDTVFSDLKDIEGFKIETNNAKNIGFTGKSCIHPKQIDLVHQIYSPSEEDLKQSIEIVKAAEVAEKNGIGVIEVNGKMIDKPIVEKAIRILEISRKEGRKYE